MRYALVAAADLGAVADMLIRGAARGLDPTAWSAAALAAALALIGPHRRLVTVAAGPLAVLALAVAMCVGWRAVLTLAPLALLSIATTACAVVRALRDAAAWTIDHAELAAYVAGVWALAGETAVGARMLGTSGTRLRPRSHPAPPAGAVGVAKRGSLPAGPLLAAFGMLLSAPDGALARIASPALAIEGTVTTGHVPWMAAAARAAAGYRAGALLGVRSDDALGTVAGSAAT